MTQKQVLEPTGIETKVQAATITGAISSLVVFLLGQYVYKGDVPQGVQDAIQVIVPAICTLVAGYFAPHTQRSPADIHATQPPPPSSWIGPGGPHAA